MSFTEEKTSFQSKGVKCVANLYKPSNTTEPVPIIVLAHGLGCVKEMRLDAFAKRFAQANYAVFLFDYRFFGESEGTPRQVLDIQCQLEDWKNAIDHVKNLSDKSIDTSKVILFGSSFSGGHVLQLCSECDVVAGVAQCPFSSGVASTLALGMMSLIKISPSVILDTIKLYVAPKSNPTLVKLAGQPRSAALMPVPDYESYLLIVPESSTWRESVGARIGFTLPFYKPGACVKKSGCPLYMSICKKDTIAPAKQTLNYAKAASKVEYKEYNCGHFDIYVGQDFEEAVEDYIQFLNKVTLPPQNL
jgi:dienelactone hydrolase